MEMSASSVCRFVKNTAIAIARLSPQYIRFPSPDETQRFVEDFYRLAQMPGVIGCIDGSHIPIQSPGGNNAEIYRCRKGYMSINVQAVCDANLKFTNIVASWPGCTHDARIFENSHVFTQLQAGNYNGRHLLGDSGYGASNFLLTPVLNPVQEEEVRYNTSHISTRNTIERAFGILKRRFAILSIPMRTKLRNSKIIIMACAVLHNIAIAQHYPVLDEQGREVILEEENEEDVDDPAYDHENVNIDGQNYRRNFINRWFRR